MYFRLGLIPLFVFAALAAGCGGGNVTIELKNAKSITVAELQAKLNPSTLASTDQTSTVTIDSLKVPIFDVALGSANELFGSSDSGTIYQCSGSTAADCEVELVGNALENLLTGGTNTGSLTSGSTYTSVMIATCGAGGATTYTAKVKAQATLAGATYYTKTGSATMTTTVADYSAVELTFSTCRNYSVLSNPIAYDGAAVTVNLYVDLRQIASAFGPGGGSTLKSAAINRMSCTTSDAAAATTPFLCLNFPDVGGTVTSGTPEVRRYKVTEAGAAPLLFGLFLASDGTPIGGYNRPYTDGTTTETAWPSFPSGFKKASLSGTTLTISDYSGGAADTAMGSGSMVTNYVDTNGDWTASFPYDIAVGASQSITTWKNASGADVSSTTFTVTRID